MSGDFEIDPYGKHFAHPNITNAPNLKPWLLNTKSIRSLYRHAEYWNDSGAKVAGSGYEPQDSIGHAVINTVRGLCDEVDRLRAFAAVALQEAEENQNWAFEFFEGGDGPGGTKTMSRSRISTLKARLRGEE